MLEITTLASHYGRIPALKGIDLSVNAGELVALVGANGAGKTTLLSAISGLHFASGGQILFAGTDITREAPHRRVRLGIGLVPEGRQVFAPLSVRDNLLLGAFTRSRSERIQTLDGVYRMFPPLAERRDHAAGALSGGQQQMLAIGRALMSRPTLLLLDEPSAQAQRNDDLPRRPERARGAGYRRSGVCARDRPDHAVGDGSGPAREPRSAVRVPRHVNLLSQINAAPLRGCCHRG